MAIFEIRDKYLGSFKNYEKIGELLFFILFSLFLLFQFLSGTMFNLFFPSHSFIYDVYIILAFLVLLKILLFNDFTSMTEFYLYVSVGLLILVGCRLANVYDIVYYYLFIVAAKDIDFDKILKTFIFVIGVSLIVTIISSQMGVIVDLTNSRNGSYGLRFALGTVFATDLAARCFYLQLAYILLRKFRMTLPEYIGAFMFTMLVYVWTDTRTDFLLMLLTIFLSVLYPLVKRAVEKIGDIGMDFSALVFISIMIVASYFYNPDNKLMGILNRVLSTRLSVGHDAFTNYNVTMFGQFVVQNGNGGIHPRFLKYFFIDCSFLRILMMNGAVTFFITLLAIFAVFRKCMTKSAFSLAIAFFMVILSSLFDHHMMEISFNVMFLALFANVGRFSEKKFS
jgi:hypothetical protein